MTVESLPPLNPPAYGEISDPDRPILSYAWRATGPHHVAAHSHARAHIIHPDAGAYWVVTPEGTWLVPSGQAIWIPPRIHHEVYSHGSVTARMLFVDETHAGSLPSQCGTVAVSPLLTELIARAVEYGNEYAPDGPATRLARVILDELAAMEVAPLLLPISGEPRLARVMQLLIDDPRSHEGLEHMARVANASPRTLARLFLAETGMSFTQWRTRLRLVTAIDRLAQGATVTEVAFEVGYRNPSSFAYAFRQSLGVPPGRYRAARSGREPPADRTTGASAPARRPGRS